MTRLTNGKKAPAPWWRGLVISVAAFILIFAVTAVAIDRVAKGTDEERLAATERAVARAVVSCYAMEGFYPPSIEYLMDNYGLEIDFERYYIHHEAFASNIYPEIYVYEKGGVG